MANKERAIALGLIVDPSAVEPLIKLLSDRKHDVRQAAATALGMIGSKGSVSALQLLVKDPDENVRQAAAASRADRAEECRDSR